MSFDTWIRIAALAVPLLVGLGIWLFVRRRRAVAEALGDPRVARRLVGSDLARPPVLRCGLVLSAAVFLGAAVALSHWGLDPDEAGVSGGPVVFVVDVSSSMLARDLTPDRLTVAKSIVRDVAGRLPGRGIGVVAFAGQAVALSAPTLDPGAVDLYLDALHPEMVTQSGSAVVGAVRQGLSLLVSSGARRGAALVLVTDGDGVDDPAEGERIAALAGRAGIPIVVLGVGTVSGAPVPDIDFRTGRQAGFKLEPGGGVATSRLNAELLGVIARESGGLFVSADEQAPSDRLLASLSSPSSDGGPDGGRDEDAPRFAWFAAAALLLLVAEWFARPASREAVV